MAKADDRPNDDEEGRQIVPPLGRTHEFAAERAGIEVDEVLKVNGAKVVHADPNVVTDPGDANPVRIDWSEIAPRMSSEQPL